MKNAFGELYLQPLSRIHLYSRHDFGISSSGDIRQIIIFSTIALLVLLIACINYMNLTATISISRIKEIGIRKAMGAFRLRVIYQFVGESILYACISLILAVALVEVAFPFFNAHVGKELGLNYGNFDVLLGLGATALLVGITAGCYPVVFLSKFKTTEVLKGFLKTGWGSLILRRIMVVVQFTASIALMIGTALIYSQVDYLRTKELGFNPQNVVIVPIRDQKFRENPDLIKRELLKNPHVMEVASAGLLPGGPVGLAPFQFQTSPVGKKPLTMQMLWVDYDFIDMLGIDVVAGRKLSRDFGMDSRSSIVLNETAIRRLGFESPADAINEPFEGLYDSGFDEFKGGKIVGVVKDFHFKSMHSRIEPLVIHIWHWLNYLLVRINPEEVSGTLAFLERKYEELDSNHPFEFSFLDNRFDKMYRSEENLTHIFGSFSMLAILIASLGLLGLASLTLGQRTKEIGIRKVLGASIANIAFLISKDFLKLVLIANCFAWPVAYYATTHWLRNFAYRIDIGPEVFVLGGIMAFVVALISISVQTQRAAFTNPVNALRYE